MIFQTDTEWARRRKPEFLGPGKIYYTREVVKDDQDVRGQYYPDQRDQYGSNMGHGGQSPPQRGTDDLYEIEIKQDGGQNRGI